MCYLAKVLEVVKATPLGVFKIFFANPARDYPEGTASCPSRQRFEFSALTDEPVAEKLLLRTVTFQGDMAAL